MDFSCSASAYKLEIYQINIKTTFLDGELVNEMYKEQLKGSYYLVKGKRFASSSIPCMDLNKLQNNGMESLIKSLLQTDLGSMNMIRVYRNLLDIVRSLLSIFGWYVDIWICDRKHKKHGSLLSSNFVVKDKGLADVVLGIKS